MIEGGTVGNPTIVQSVNVRGAHITAKSGGTYGGASTANDGPGIIGQSITFGSITQVGYVEIRDLKLSGTKAGLIRFGVNDSSGGAVYTPGIVIDGCELTDVSALTGLDSGGNIAAISLNLCVDAVVNDNKIYNIVGYAANNGNHTSATIQWGSHGTIYTRNTLYNCGNGIFSKVDNQNQYGGEIAYNYIDVSNNTDEGFCIEEFQGKRGTTVVGSTLLVHHNVLIGAECVSFRLGGSTLRMSTEDVRIYFNTCVLGGSMSSPSMFISNTVHDPGITRYGNLYSYKRSDGTSVSVSTTSEYGTIMEAAGTPTLANYEVYSTTSNKWTTFANDASAYPSTSYSTLASWKSARGETNSQAISDPGFVGTGILAYQYQLSGGSAAKSLAKSDGLSTGTTTDPGAFGNNNASVGGWGST